MSLVWVEQLRLMYSEAALAEKLAERLCVGTEVPSEVYSIAHVQSLGPRTQN